MTKITFRLGSLLRLAGWLEQGHEENKKFYFEATFV